MPQITFTADHHYETHGPKKGPKFSKDEVVNASPDFADRCAMLGVAEITGRGEPKAEDGKFTRVKGTKAGSDFKPEKGDPQSVQDAAAADANKPPE